MKETSATIRSGAVGQLPGSQRAGVAALDHGHALVVAQRPVQLAVGDVERDHRRRAALEQAVGEAAGGGAHVEARAGPAGSTPKASRALASLMPAARDELRPLGDLQVGVRRDQLARLAGRPVRPPARRRPSPRPPPAVRVSNSPRSASSVSSRRFGIGAEYPRLCDPRHTVCDSTGRNLEHLMTIARLISPSLRSGLLMAAGTGLIGVPFAIGLAAAAIVTGLTIGVRDGCAGPRRHRHGRARAHSRLRPGRLRPRHRHRPVSPSAHRSGSTGDLGAALLFATAGLAALIIDLDHALQREHGDLTTSSQDPHSITPPSRNGPAPAGSFRFRRRARARGRASSSPRARPVHGGSRSGSARRGCACRASRAGWRGGGRRSCC